MASSAVQSRSTGEPTFSAIALNSLVQLCDLPSVASQSLHYAYRPVAPKDDTWVATLLRKRQCLVAVVPDWTSPDSVDT